MERGQRAVSGQSKSSPLRHVLLMASNPRVIPVATPSGLIIIVTSQSVAAHLVDATVSSEIAEAAAETALTADVNSAAVAEVLLVLAGLFAALAACMS